MPLTLALKKKHLHVLELPLLQMTTLTLSAQDNQKIANLLTGKYDMLVVISPTAAVIGCRHIGSMNKSTFFGNISVNKSMQTVAVGQATSDTLSESGIQATLPELASNEGMLSLKCIKDLNKNSRVLIWRGKGGRKLLINELNKRGVQVDVLELYDRQFPQATTIRFNQWLKTNKHHSQKITTLISSGEAFKHWQQLISTQTTVSIKDFQYLVLGKRLSKMLNVLNLQHLTIENLQPSTIISTIENHTDSQFIQSY